MATRAEPQRPGCPATCEGGLLNRIRDCLVTQGREWFESAGRHPDSLAGAVDSDEEVCEYECRPAWDTWCEKTGTERGQEEYNALLTALKERHPKKIKGRGTGRRWDLDDDDQVGRRLTRPEALDLDRDSSGNDDD